jgi:hypothetical protein
VTSECTVYRNLPRMPALGGRAITVRKRAPHDVVEIDLETRGIRLYRIGNRLRYFGEAERRTSVQRSMLVYPQSNNHE